MIALSVLIFILFVVFAIDTTQKRRIFMDQGK